MDSIPRARYEFALSAAARNIRLAATILEDAGQPRAADELALLEAYLRSEVNASIKGRRPMSTGLKLISSRASSRHATARPTQSPAPSLPGQLCLPASNDGVLPET